MKTKKYLFVVLCFSLAGTAAFAQDTATKQKIQKIDQALAAAAESYPQGSNVAYVNMALLKHEAEAALQAHPYADYETLYNALNPVLVRQLAYRLQKAPLSAEEINRLVESFANSSKQNQSMIRMLVTAQNIRALAAQDTYEKMQKYIQRQKELPYFSEVQASKNMFTDRMIDLLGPVRMAALLKQLFANHLAVRPFSQEESQYLALQMNLSEKNTKLMESLLKDIR